MKKNLFAIVFILAGALSISPLTFALESQQVKEELPSVMYASNKDLLDEELDQTEVEKDDSSIDYDSNIAKNTDKSSSVVNDNSNNNEVYKNKHVARDDSKINHKESSNASYVKKNKASVENNASQKEKNTENKNSNIDAGNKSRKVLNREEAVELLNKENKNNQEYGYMGDENTFNVLKEKGHEGYVFVPDTSTDLGLFVDKNTSEVYVFHPSGSLDLY